MPVASGGSRPKRAARRDFTREQEAEMNEGYAGDLRPAEAWALLEKDPKAVLIDVRTAPEWGFVGVPRLDGLGKEALCISWQAYPQMQRNEDFAAEVAAKGVAKDPPVLLLCRSGARSRAARSEERRVGQACVLTCRSSWSPDP